MPGPQQVLNRCDQASKGSRPSWTEDDGAHVMRLVWWAKHRLDWPNQTQAMGAYSKARGPHSWEREWLQAAQSWGRGQLSGRGWVSWESRGEGGKIVLQSSLKNKQRAWTKSLGAQICCFLTKGILKTWLPLCFPLGLHLWLTTEARGLNLGFSAAQAQREGCCSLSKEGRGKWGLGGAREEGGRLHQRLLVPLGSRPSAWPEARWGSRFPASSKPQPGAGCGPGACAQRGWGESETPRSHPWKTLRGNSETPSGNPCPCHHRGRLISTLYGRGRRGPLNVHPLFQHCMKHLRGSIPCNSQQ